MKKKYILFCLIFTLFTLLLINSKCYAQDLDEIVDYTVTVNPRMNDGSLDITYEIIWKVLDSTTEGPLEWVRIGAPNSNFRGLTAISKNIKSISSYNESFVKIVFDKPYHSGEEVSFKYSLNQPYLYKKTGSKCKYDFTPAWFESAKIDRMTVKWNKEDVTKSNSKSKEDNYLIWKKTEMPKGSKMNIKVEYKKTAFRIFSK